MPLTPENDGIASLLNLMHVLYLLVVVYCHREPKAALSGSRQPRAKAHRTRYTSRDRVLFLCMHRS